MRVNIIIDDGVSADDRKLIRRALIRSTLRGAGDVMACADSASVTVRCTTDDVLAELNEQYRFTPGPTDVLAFPYGDARQIGDIAVSLDRVRAQGGERPVEELRLLVVHGFLHCLGYDHATPEEASTMTTLTRACLPQQQIEELETHDA